MIIPKDIKRQISIYVAPITETKLKYIKGAEGTSNTSEIIRELINQKYRDIINENREMKGGENM